MTSTLETALADLPAKPRVHELSKRLGISNKELLAALAERGLSISSASASVPRPVALELITTLLGGGDNTADGSTAETPPPREGPTSESAVAGDRSADQPAAAGPDTARPQILGDTPGSAGLAINPLFLPPAEVAPSRPPRRRKAQPAPDTDVPELIEPDHAAAEPDADTDTDTAPTGGRRRRGRSGKGRRAGADRAEDRTNEGSSNEDRNIEDQPASGAHRGTDFDRAIAAAASESAHSADVVPTDTSVGEASTGTADERHDGAGDEADDDSSARGRRRRRGRRGRGRISDGDDQQSDDPAGDAGTDNSGARAATPEAPVTVDEPAPEETAASGTDTDSDSDDSDSDNADSDNADSDNADSDNGAAGAGNRRRRRRRRRANGDEVAREDDPDNTVVHVREPRLSQSATAGASSGSGEVQGVRGSTRLEAKRQRRRDSRDSSRRRPQILTEAEFLARRESVERVMAVRQRGGLAQVALLEDGVLVEHFVSQTGSDSMIGSVFLGKVQNVLPSMEAAFVDIGRGRNAVIYAGEVNWDAAGLNGKARRIETALSSGDTILAQVSKDPVGHKGARLTTQISLPGRFVVYVPGGGATGISRKLPDTERKRLKSIMDRIVPEDAGVIIRTAAEGIAEDELARDVERLKGQWDEITRRAAEKTSAPTQLYAEPGTLIKVVRDLFNSDINRLVVDGDEAYEPVAEYINAVAPELADRLVRYESATPKGPDVFATYRVDEQIAKALERKVHLPSGGSLVIDRTEAMTVVDVNTGKYTGSGGNLEETVTKNNLEAAEEIVRQLRLRDIGGIIVVDFIDMVLESNRELVLRRLTEALGRDRTRHQVAEVTSLGLVQMTRKRMGTGLVEAFSEPCPHCGGRGIMLHDMPMVAAPVEDGASERRTGKSRRSRGREERVEEIVIPRVVEQTPGRRPDPRGPKPPPAAVAERDIPVGSRSGSADGDRQLVTRTAQLGVDADEVDWIEAAASAGIAAADAADADDFEFGEPTAEEAAELSTQDRTGTGAARGQRSAGEATADTDTQETGAPESGSAQVGDGAAGNVPAERVSVGSGAGTAENGQREDTAAPPAAHDAPAPPPARRRRRAAGRPAGAPAGASGPVDILVPESVATDAAETAAQVDVSTSDDQSSSSAGREDDQGGADSGGAEQGNPDQGGPELGGPDQGGPDQGGPDQGGGNNDHGSSTEVAAPVAGAPPRRRRAASRPAGPAAGNGGEALVLTVPADGTS